MTLPKSIAREKFAQNIKTYRLNKEISVYKAAKEMHFHPSYLGALENMNPPKNPSMETIDTLANYYNVEIYELFL